LFLRNKQQLVVECYAPWKVRLAWWLAAGLAAALAWIYWIDLPQRLEAVAVQHEARRMQLMEQLRRARSEQGQLGEQLKDLRRRLELERKAKQQVQGLLRDHEQESFRRRQQLAFYQSIVDPPDKQAGLKLESFQIDPSNQPGAQEGRYRYRLVVIQALHNDKVVRGKVTLELSGTQNGQPRTLGLRELARPPVAGLALEFRYFQTLEGELQLPQGFAPSQVHINVEAKWPHRGIDETLAWMEAS
jgi:hypothetical protein